MPFRPALLTALAGTVLVAACASTKPAAAPPTEATSVEGRYVSLAKDFRAKVKAKDYDEAHAMMASSAHRWFEKREGDGEVWTVGPDANDPWKGWDEHFRSESVDRGWKEGDHSATLTIHETNDFYKLEERGGSTTELWYFFDDAGRINGLMIHGVSEDAVGLQAEFLKWARANAPDELAYLQPGGKINPTGDRPPRFRALLNRWRTASGLSTIP